AIAGLDIRAQHHVVYRHNERVARDAETAAGAHDEVCRILRLAAALLLRHTHAQQRERGAAWRVAADQAQGRLASQHEGAVGVWPGGRVLAHTYGAPSLFL